VRPRLRFLSLWLLLLSLAGCTGTFTDAVPTLYLVFIEEPGQPARIALLALRTDQSGRSVQLLEENAALLDADATLLALDVRDREGRDEVWLLSGSRTTPRATSLHRFDLQGIADTTGARVQTIETIPLTDADGRWLERFNPASAVPSGCLTDLVVQGNGAEVLLVDSGSGGRCGTFSDGVDPRVHRLQLAPAGVSERVAFPLGPAARPGSDGNEVLLVQRPTVGAEAEVRRDGFAPIPNAPHALVAALQDVRPTREGFAALTSSGGDQRRIELVPLPDANRSERAALPRAERLWLLEDSRGVTLISAATAGLGIDYPSQENLRQLSFAARDITIDANAYALAVGDAGVCFLDLLVSSEARSCDIQVSADINNRLRFARLAAWTYADVSVP
jgi:hypothetical protein